MGEELVSSLLAPTLILGAGWGPEGEAPRCRQAPLLSDSQSNGFPGEVSLTGAWSQVGSCCLLNSRSFRGRAELELGLCWPGKEILAS